MLPLRDNIKSRSFPIVNTAIIVTCAVVFLWQMIAAPDRGLSWAFVPRALVSPAEILGGGLVTAWLTLLTSIFLHATTTLLQGTLHLAMNMLFLWVFGDNVEDRMGHGRYLAFYLICGIAGNLLHALFSGFAAHPLVGASGAVAGVMGAYFVLFRMASVRTLVIIIFFPIVFDLPAPIFLVYWFILQFFSGLTSIGATAGVAFWAHIGGFAAGYFLVKRFATPLRPPPTRRIQPRVVDLRIE